MADGIRWTIGIPTVPARRKIRQRVLDQLDKQIEPYDDIELLVLEDNRKRELGVKRQALVDMAQGQYICFIDDDDLISDDYIQKIHPLLDGVADCVGITAQISLEGADWVDVHYSKDNKQRNLPDCYLRPIQHLTPVKTEHVKKIPYRGHRHEDSDWARRMINAQHLQVENKCDGVVYYYFATARHNRLGVWK